MENLIERLKEYNEQTKIKLKEDLEIQGESQRLRLVSKRENKLYHWLKEQATQSGLTIREVKERLDYGLEITGDVSPNLYNTVVTALWSNQFPLFAKEFSEKVS